MTTTYVFYGEDRRHIEKGATAYHGFRLDLTKSVDLGAIKAKATAMAAAGSTTRRSSRSRRRRCGRRRCRSACG